MTEQVAAPVNDNIYFTYPWVLKLSPPDEYFNVDEPNFNRSGTMVTSHNVASIFWDLHSTGPYLFVSSSRMPVWNASCKVSYKIFTDNEMQAELFSSPKTSTDVSTRRTVSFYTPNRFKKPFYQYFEGGTIAKVEFLVELSIPMKNFNRPFDLPMHPLNKKHCNEYPEDMEKNSEFELLRKGDYSIKCRDGSVLALRKALNDSSYFMMNHFKESNDDELAVEYSLDAVKPVIIYIHTLCFQMPKSFGLDYADRLLKAIDYFEPVQNHIEPEQNFINLSIELSLCQKFVEEHHDFDSLLKWLTVASRNHFTDLLDMISTLILNKFFFKWTETFPENARNVENPIYRDVFGFEGNKRADHNEYVKGIFVLIEKAFMRSLYTNVILP